MTVARTCKMGQCYSIILTTKDWLVRLDNEPHDQTPDTSNWDYEDTSRMLLYVKGLVPSEIYESLYDQFTWAKRVFERVEI